jgi:uncharacterized ferritin-like protein (DUF455 family)
MENIFAIAEACLYDTALEAKLTMTHQAKALLVEQQLTFHNYLTVKPIDLVQFAEKPVLLSPHHMPKRNLTTREGVIAFFHAIAHVEFMAILLAWDIIYRFRELPAQFYQDWIIVADEEAQHFELIRGFLQSMDTDYGDLPAHGGLWEHATATANNLLGRIALVPRCMEARGLDVTPGIIERFKLQNHVAAIAILTRILTDEVTHVERGSYWFKYFCNEQGLQPDAEYARLISHYFVGGKPKGPFNLELRKIAGFSADELAWLQAG